MNSLCPRAAPRASFTLIELLTVIAVIAILAALLIPAVTFAQRANGTVASAANLRQLGAAILSFASDNNNHPPASNNGGITWDSRIFPYVNLGPAGGTPRATGVTIFAARNDNTQTVTAGSYKRSYAMVVATSGTAATTSPLLNNSGTSSTIYVQPLTAIQWPAETLLLTEYPGFSGNTVSGTNYYAVNNPTQQASAVSNLNIGGKFNYLFYDGHVDLLLQSQTYGTGSASSPHGGWTLTPLQ